MKLLVCENKKITEGGLHKKGVIDKISNNKQMIAEPNNTRLVVRLPGPSDNPNY